MNLPITIPATIRRRWQRQHSRSPLTSIILAATLLGLLGVYVVAQLVLFLLTPYNQPYPRDLLAKAIADYSTWQNQPGLPAIDPDAVNAAELDQIPGAGPIKKIPAAVVPRSSTQLPVEQTTLPTATPALSPEPATPTPTPSPEPPTPTSMPTANLTPLPTDIPLLALAPTVEAVPPTEALPTATPEPPLPPTEPPLPPTATEPPAPTSTPRPPIVGQPPINFPTAKPAQPGEGGTPVTKPIETPEPTSKPPTPTSTPSATATATATSTPLPTSTATSTPLPTRQPLLALTDVLTISEDSPAITLAVLENDSDPEGEALTLERVSPPTGGSADVDGDLVIYTPRANFAGLDSFGYIVSSDDGRSVEGAISIYVLPVNDPPVAVDNSITIQEDTPVTINVLTNDVDVDGDALLVISTTKPLRGNVTIVGGATQVRYAPRANFAGVDSFRYTVSDSKGGTASATVTITVQAQNDPPQANDDGPLTLYEDQSLTIDILANDSDPEGDALTILQDIVPPTLTVTLDPVSQKLKATPPPDFSGTITFSYKLQDAGGLSDTATVTLTVIPVNDPPSFRLVTNALTVTEGLSVYTTSLLLADVRPGPDAPDENIQALSYTVRVSNRNLFSAPPAIAPNGVFSFTLAPNAFGSAILTITLHDSGGTANGGQDTSAPQLLALNVEAVNDPPSFVPGGNLPAVGRRLLEDSGAYRQPWATSVSAGPNEYSQTVSFAVTATNKALFRVQPQIDAGGDLSFTPADDANGSTLVTVTLRDSLGATTNPITFEITLEPVNDAPRFALQDTTIITDKRKLQWTVPRWATAIRPGPETARDEIAQTLNFRLTASDRDFFSVQPEINPYDPQAGTLTFTLAPTATGSVTVSVTLQDNAESANGGVDISEPQLFTVTVDNSPPAAEDDTATLIQDSGAATIDVLANDNDPDSSVAPVELRIIDITQGRYGAVSRAADDKSLSYRPARGFKGNDSFSYTITDGVLTDTATVTVTVSDDFNMGTCEGVAVVPTILSQTSPLTATTLTVTLDNSQAELISDLRLEMQVYTNTNEAVVDTAFSSVGIQVVGELPKLIYSSTENLAPGLHTFTLRYSHTLSAPITADDSFRAWFTVGGERCAVGGKFPASTLDYQPPTPPVVNISFKDPISDSLVITRDQATFEVTVTVTGQPANTGVAFVGWRIVDATNNKAIHNWNEYAASWCAFGNVNEGGAGGCATPAETQPSGEKAWRPQYDDGWWDRLPSNRRYRIEAYAQGGQGNASAVITREFIKQ